MSNDELMSYEEVQADITRRAGWAQICDQYISANFQEWGNCETSYNKTFESNAEKIGTGVYGKIFKSYLRHMPRYPIAVKRSNTQEIDEARRMILISALVESGFSPHFSILFAHFHCEEIPSRERTTQNVTYIESLTKIKELETKKKELESIPPNERTIEVIHAIEEIPKQVNDLIKSRVPTIEEIQWITGVKNKLAQRSKLSLESPTLIGNEELTNNQFISRNTRTLFEKANDVLREMLEKRQLSSETKPYEIFAMEYLDNTAMKWLPSRQEATHLLSFAFQVCAGILSLLSYLGIVQNDLHTANIMYNKVPEDTTYIYQLGSQIYKVPIKGHLFKIIDFGLATNIRHDPYCIGAKSDFKTTNKCYPYNRDFIEFFDKLLQYYSRFLPYNFRNWCEMCYDQWNLEITNIKIAARKFMYIFKTSTLREYDLPSFEMESITNPQMYSIPQNNPIFFILANPDRRQTVMNIALKKKWIENRE